MSGGAPEILSLAAGDLALDLCPKLGGSVTGLRWRHPSGEWVDLLRPTNAASLASRNIEGVSCFPLTPFSNRLRKGRFEFQGREIVLPRNTDGPHVEHGHGWQSPWQAVDGAPDHAVLRLTHRADAWPFDYVIEQRFQLHAGALDVELMARNDSDRAMPFGFGLHPYFPRTPDCRLTAAVAGFWETDAEVMPLRHIPPPRGLDPTPGFAVADQRLDNALTGWQGRAIIDWPERATRLTMAATAALGFLVVYIPPDADYFCAEPVSNCTDAFNLAHARADTGMLVVEPNQHVSARVAFSPECTPDPTTPAILRSDRSRC
jgi:aldose 1-epimerase